jgi:cyclophilin family peptidyl-prolyl cis-trans isomerase
LIANNPSATIKICCTALSGNSIQGGAIGSPNNDGSLGTSAYEGGKPFLPDNYNIRHTLPGLVSAVRANSEGLIDSRFFIQTERDAGWADGRYAAFGIVLDDENKGGDDGNGGGSSGGGGMDLVRRISRVDVSRPRNSPKESVTIVGCGLL